MGMRIAEVCRVHPRGRVYMPCGYFARDPIHYVGRSGLFSAFGIVLTVLRSGVGTRSRIAQKLQCTVHWIWFSILQARLSGPAAWTGWGRRPGWLAWWGKPAFREKGIVIVKVAGSFSNMSE
jgi:hypothetical protein